jgi:hypothetical protein
MNRLHPNQVFLALSLAANLAFAAVLLARSRDLSRLPPVVVVATLAPPPAATATPPDLKTLAPAVLRTELGQLGLPKETVDALVRARIFARHDARRRELIHEAANSPHWWRAAGLRIDPLRTLTPAQRKELRDLETAARDEALALLGPAALDRDGALAFRYRYVPPEKAVLLDALERDYKNLGAELDESSRWFRTPGDLEHKKLLAAERDRDLAALLTPTEREIFELRESPAAQQYGFGLQMSAFEASEEEYRKLFALQKAAHVQLPDRGGSLSAEAGARVGAVFDQLQLDIRATLGETRYADWVMAAQQHYTSLVGFARANDIPRETVREVAGIVTDTLNGSWRLATDASLTGPQKKTGLADLVAAARVQVAAKLGPDLAAAYLKDGSTHFDAMASGSAFRINPRGGFGVTPVDSPRLPSAPSAPKP